MGSYEHSNFTSMNGALLSEKKPVGDFRINLKKIPNFSKLAGIISIASRLREKVEILKFFQFYRPP